MRSFISGAAIVLLIGICAGLTATGGGSAVAGRAAGPSYRFLARQADGRTPVAYDPCRAIHYVVRPEGEPAGGDEIIGTAVARISQATGLHFVYDGTTAEGPTRHRASYQPDTYGDRWAPVLVSWADAVENPDFAVPDVVGEGGSHAAQAASGPRIFVSGIVTLDAERLTRILRRPDGEQIVRAVVLHELGHLVGLAHVTAPGQLMSARRPRGVTDFGAGDLAGLSVLGKGVCLPAGTGPPLGS